MTREPAAYRGDDTLLFGIILGVLAFWLFALSSSGRRFWIRDPSSFNGVTTGLA